MSLAVTVCPADLAGVCLDVFEVRALPLGRGAISGTLGRNGPGA